MLTADLHYELPEAAIAQTPAEPRDSARLLVDRGPEAAPDHRTVADLADLLDEGDVLVLNNTRVMPARLRMVKPSGGAVEVLLLERHPDGFWEALVKPGRRVPPGTRLFPSEGSPPPIDFTAEVGESLGEDGRRKVTLTAPDTPAGSDRTNELALLEAVGEVPLPPYIHRPIDDPDRYQTVYAATPSSVAAPTAGLHLTTEVLDRCRQRGVTVLTVDLAVGLGTFRPVTTTTVEDHPMHPERFRIPPETRAVLAPRGRVERPSGRVVAVGTTTVRALESWAARGQGEGSTDLFIHPGHRFAVVDRLLTNFHVPCSSLLAMVQAFIGPRWRDLYEMALEEHYRFLSFGDAMLLDLDPGGNAPPDLDPGEDAP